MASLSLPVMVWIGLIFTPVAIAIGQILFKVASGRVERFDLAGLVALMLDPVFMLALSLYGATTFMWVFVLRSVPLSIAYSFMGITYLAVPVLSALFLGEVLTWRSYVGAMMIIGGLLVVNG